MNTQQIRQEDSDFVAHYMSEQHPDRANLGRPACICTTAALSVDTDVNPYGYDPELENE